MYIPLLSVARGHPPPHCENTQVLREAITEDEGFIPLAPHNNIYSTTRLNRGTHFSYFRANVCPQSISEKK